MSAVLYGTVKDGLIVPSVALPEGTSVEIRVTAAVDVPPELAAELAAWQLASAEALELVEQEAKRGDTHATG